MMINLKKAAFTFCLGLGLTAAATSSWALPDMCTCWDMKQACDAGDASSCTNFNRYRCYYFDYSNADSYCG